MRTIRASLGYICAPPLIDSRTPFMPRPFPLRVLVSLLLIPCCLVFCEDARLEPAQPADPGSKLVSALGPFLDVMTGKAEHYTIRAEFNVGGKSGTAELVRAAARDYGLHVK